MRTMSPTKIPSNVFEPAYNTVEEDNPGKGSDSWGQREWERVRYLCGRGYEAYPIDDIRQQGINLRKRRSVSESKERRAAARQSPPEYRAYLQSNHWLRFRQRVIHFWGGRCAVCYKIRASDVHHRTYERLGKELLTDCLLLCRPCHDLVEEQKTNPTNGLFIGAIDEP